jgi:hypothetical protein
MSLLALILYPPLALNGESVSGKGTAIGVISVVSIVCGYVVLGALWWFVFRERPRRKRKRGSSD